ncbi:MAG TPA: sigma-70 family RNA polymerase sigma factor [Amaricoccus sp.]|uniref:RNA polymerase sigma factor n=1 Tax=Amaricoccus sp. TaxID=1872485 RepID=UPI002BBDE050|nr:sigma-70 family RNA polymerase sigma factor [Amaricoccus sp.]HMQ93899.1 sigma-70 family RNA polymerase sigma factor [Amaricoccus sp.]HMR51057.1 sigma-70 family RNA polymerase sigma factor [Amaricoccus sp.]HMR60003.1 sigma-70 family RNA polymerase sigma factor [Amaricoccus sp.]HMU00334.1 sigma-70 family RNA polymerase sigma factor [Amaricoccus sp.]
MNLSSILVSELYVRERGRLGRIGTAITADAREAEDVVQDVFVRLLAGAVEPRGEGLLVRMARNLAIDRLRRRRHREAARPAVAAASATETPDPEAALAAREELRGLVKMLTSMPERRRRTFLMSRLDGMPQAEIARDLGVSLSTVEKDLRAALDICLAWKREHEGR